MFRLKNSRKAKYYIEEGVNTEEATIVQTAVVFVIISKYYPKPIFAIRAEITWLESFISFVKVCSILTLKY